MLSLAYVHFFIALFFYVSNVFVYLNVQSQAQICSAITLSEKFGLFNKIFGS